MDATAARGLVSGQGAASTDYLRDDALLKVRNLTVTFRRGSRNIQAVAGVSFDVARGETLGLVGESGSGKTTIGRAVLRLLPKASAGMSGCVEYGAEDLGSVSKARMRVVRRHLQEIRATKDLALIFISHDLAVVRNVSDRVAVLYMGKIVETGEADRIYSRPAHPYTRTLLEAVPVPDASVKLTPTSSGSEMPSQFNPPSGCRFRTRCPRAQQVCTDVEPLLRRMPQGQFAACHFPHDEVAPGVVGTARGV